MNDMKLLSLTFLVIASCASVLAQDAPPPYEEHRFDKSGEPCVKYDGGEGRCTTVELSWVTFDNLPALNDTIAARVKGILADWEEPDTTGTLEQLAEDWFSRLREEAAQDTLAPRHVWIWDFQQNISVHDRRGNLLTLDTGSYIYTGGAHGLPSIGYLHWDLDRDRAIMLDSLLIQNQEETFWDLAREAHLRWAEAHDLNHDYLDGWPFDTTEEFYFGKGGLTLVYNVYQIAPYAMGPQELVIPWEALEDVIEPEYLSLVR